MVVWAFLTVGIVAVAIGCLFYIATEIRRCFILQKLKAKSRLCGWLVPLIAVAVAALVLFLTMGVYNAAICIAVLSLFSALCRLIVFVVKKICKREFRLNYAVIGAIVITGVYLGVGWYFAHDVKLTAYTLDTDKQVGELRIVQFADSHIGALFDADGFSDYVDEMNAQNPDLVFITGDFVDDDTSRADMLGAAAALAKFDTTYGVYFVCGNHDGGYYSAEARGWTKDELFAALVSSNVTILSDETVVIADRINIIGRLDASSKDRKSMSELTAALDMDKYTIVLDHQPNDYDAQHEANVDLVLSGHTHGGQFFPINIFVALANDRVYGHETRGNTNFIVTSGLGDWAIKFKIGCIAEYTVIDVQTKDGED